MDTQVQSARECGEFEYPLPKRDLMGGGQQSLQHLSEGHQSPREALPLMPSSTT